MYSSRMVNRVAPSLPGARVKVRTPLNRPCPETPSTPSGTRTAGRSSSCCARRPVGQRARRGAADQPARRLAAPASTQAGRAGCRSGRRHPAPLPARRRGHRRGARVPGGCLGGSRDPVPAAGREHQREDRTGRSVTEPIRIEFEVACSPAHAFDTWASKTSMWWPRSHSMSSAPGLVVTFESRPGGRIYERTPDGIEHDWGDVLAWERPAALPISGTWGPTAAAPPRSTSPSPAATPAPPSPSSTAAGSAWAPTARLASAQPRRLERPAAPLPAGGSRTGRCRVPRWGSLAHRGERVRRLVHNPAPSQPLSAAAQDLGGVDQLVGVALLGQEPLAALGVVGVVGVAADHGVEAGPAAVGLGA